MIGILRPEKCHPPLAEFDPGAGAQDDRSQASDLEYVFIPVCVTHKSRLIPEPGEKEIGIRSRTDERGRGKECEFPCRCAVPVF